MSNLDWNVGRLIEMLRKRNILDDTFIIVTTEHERTWAERPGTSEGMCIAYEEASRIPLILRYPPLLPYDERALRTERWKLILRKFDVRPELRPGELYDMQADRKEIRNLYGSQRPVVKELAEILRKWGEETEDALAVELGRYAEGG